MVYLDLWMLLNFAVDILLLLGTNSLAGFPLSPGRCAAGAAVGGAYSGLCLLPGFFFLADKLWRLVFLGMMSAVAFGRDWRRWILFVLLSMALGGLALGLGRGNGMLMLAAAALAALCLLGFRGKVGQRFEPMVLRYQGRQTAVTALRDTGNTLRDPISGEAVLVVGADVGEMLLGLTLAEIAAPIETVAKTPGLRLIPYRAVGCSGGMLLAARLEAVERGKAVKILVAFAPQTIGNQGYQALIGGS